MRDETRAAPDPEAPVSGDGTADTLRGAGLIYRAVLGIGIVAVAASHAPADDRATCIGELGRRPAYRAFLDRDPVRALDLAREAWSATPGDEAPLHAAFAAADVAAALALDGRVDDALAWYDTSQDLLDRVGKLRRTRGRLHAARAVALYVAHRTAAAEAEMDLALDRLGEDDWDARFARLAWREWWSFDVVTALDELRELTAPGQDLDRPRRAAALMLQGRLEGHGGGARRRYYEMAIEMFREADDPTSEALARRNIGVIELRSRDLEAAEEELGAALELARSSSDTRLAFIVLNDMSIALAQAGHTRRAIEADERAEALLDSILDDVRAGRVHDDLNLDLYNLLGLRHQSMPNMLFDPFPVILEQLALRAENDGRICNP